MAGKTAAKKNEKIESGGKPQPARMRSCDHCGQAAPGSELQAKLLIDYSSGSRSKRMLRLIKGHA